MHVIIAGLVWLLSRTSATARVRRASHTEGPLRFLEQFSITFGQSQVLEDFHLLGKEDSTEDD